MTIFGWKITFKKETKRKRKTLGFTSRPWSPEDTQFILDQNNAGLSPRKISEQLRDRTPAAIASRLNKVRKN